MPRGKKKTIQDAINEQLEKINSRLENYQEKIDELESKRDDLLKQKQEQELLELSAKIKASGKTVDEVLKAIK